MMMIIFLQIEMDRKYKRTYCPFLSARKLSWYLLLSVIKLQSCQNYVVSKLSKDSDKSDAGWFPLGLPPPPLFPMLLMVKCSRHCFHNMRFHNIHTYIRLSSLGGGEGTWLAKREMKNFWKDCVLYAINTDPSRPQWLTFLRKYRVSVETLAIKLLVYGRVKRVRHKDTASELRQEEIRQDLVGVVLHQL